MTSSFGFKMRNKEISSAVKNRKKSFDHIEKSFRTIMNHLDAIQADDDLIDQPETMALVNNIQNIARPKNGTKNMAPKILESFQNITPKRPPLILKNTTRRAISKTDGKVKKPPRITNPTGGDDLTLRTLYRNKNMDLGKIVPNHKIMRNLLQNYQDSMEVETIIGASTFSLKKPSIQRLDKATSTTDMPWEDLRKKPWRRPIHKFKIQQKSKSIIPARKQSRELFSKQNALRQSQDGPFSDNKIISSPSYVCSHCEGDTFVLEDESQLDKFNKSYVSSQAEKFNKSFVNSQTDDKFNNSLGAKKTISKGQKSKLGGKNKLKNVSSRNYVGMINTVKNKYPKLEINNEPMSTDNHYDWSDEPPEPEISTLVKFPKETRSAMERMIQNSKIPDYMRVPLTKYMQSKEKLNIQPAISFNRVDIGSAKMSYTRKTSPYTICKNLEPIPGSKESGGIGDYVGPNGNSGKGIPSRRSATRVTRKIQKPRGVR